jgi:hypothetical protein
VLLGDDARRADADDDYQDLYTRSIRPIHSVPPLESVWLLGYSAA